MNDQTYRLFDQAEKLGDPPWRGPALEAWEQAHGHDARLRCYSEFGCSVLAQLWDRLEETATKVVEYVGKLQDGGSVPVLEMEAVVKDLEEVLAELKRA